MFEADIFVGQSEDEVEVRCEVSRRVKIAVSGFGVSSDKFGKPINFRPQKRSTVSFGSNLPLMASSSQSLPDPQRNPR